MTKYISEKNFDRRWLKKEIVLDIIVMVSAITHERFAMNLM